MIDITTIRRDDKADALGVARFSRALLEKLSEKRSEGKSGWNRPLECSESYLWKLLKDHVRKGDPVDIGNLAMMIWNRRNRTEAKP